MLLRKLPLKLILVIPALCVPGYRTLPGWPVYGGYMGGPRHYGSQYACWTSISPRWIRLTPYAPLQRMPTTLPLSQTQPPPPKLGYKTICCQNPVPGWVIGTQGDCGSTEWWIDWTLANGTGFEGWIIQHVTRQGTSNGCGGGSTPINSEWFEAWKISGGSICAGLACDPEGKAYCNKLLKYCGPVDFWNNGAQCGTRGSQTITGVAKLFLSTAKGLPDPSGWGISSGGCLPTSMAGDGSFSSIKAYFPGSGTSAVTRSQVFNWNCCSAPPTVSAPCQTLGSAGCTCVNNVFIT